MELKVNLKDNSYPIIFDKLDNILNYASFDNKTLIVSDDNIPQNYIDNLKNKINADVFIFKHGEESKNIQTYLQICEFLLKHNYSRKDTIVALGGGVSGDMAAFVSSTFKRGMRFINIPTSSLAMIDSSVGGKTGIDFQGVKNAIGTFFQPSLVYIDIDLLKSLDERNLRAGLIEALKAGLIYDKELYELFKEGKYQSLEEIKNIIIKALKVKIAVVQIDEKETHLRKILNFGHTIGHGLETSKTTEELIHGEAVALGMLYALSDDLKEEVRTILKQLKMPLDLKFDLEKVKELIKNDKKASGKKISFIRVEKVGEAIIDEVDLDLVFDLVEKEER